ncbi:MAG TPA: M24 family metallopeptidase, partial [Chloroflexia bacterium]|nr:M24 family metallopeptidase [Chloroflexia bacterium]
MITYNYQAGSVEQKREAAAKRDRILKLLQDNQLDGLVLNTQHNFAWATAGANNWVSIAGDRGVASLVIKADGSRYAVLDNLEQPRLEDEEQLKALGFQVIPAPWWEAGQRDKLLLDLARGGKKGQVGADTPLEGGQDVSHLINPARWSLLPDERARYRQVCQAAGDALESTCMDIVPGMSEWDVAGLLAQSCFQRGLLPFVLLVASDERIFKYRHPIPTDKKVERYVMVVLCAKAGGLIANATRLVHFGPVSPEIIQKYRELLTVD